MVRPTSSGDAFHSVFFDRGACLQWDHEGAGREREQACSMAQGSGETRDSCERGRGERGESGIHLDLPVPGNVRAAKTFRAGCLPSLVAAIILRRVRQGDSRPGDCRKGSTKGRFRAKDTPAIPVAHHAERPDRSIVAPHSTASASRRWVMGEFDRYNQRPSDEKNTISDECEAQGRRYGRLIGLFYYTSCLFRLLQ